MVTARPANSSRSSFACRPTNSKLGLRDARWLRGLQNGRCLPVDDLYRREGAAQLRIVEEGAYRVDVALADRWLAVAERDVKRLNRERNRWLRVVEIRFETIGHDAHGIIVHPGKIDRQHQHIGVVTLHPPGPQKAPEEKVLIIADDLSLGLFGGGIGNKRLQLLDRKMGGNRKGQVPVLPPTRVKQGA